MIKALAAGVPLGLLPMGRDQPDNAAGVLAAGAGVRLRQSASPAKIAAAELEQLASLSEGVQDSTAWRLSPL